MTQLSDAVKKKIENEADQFSDVSATGGPAFRSGYRLGATKYAGLAMELRDSLHNCLGIMHGHGNGGHVIMVMENAKALLAKFDSEVAGG